MLLLLCISLSTVGHLVRSQGPSCQDTATSFCQMLSGFNAVIQYCRIPDSGFTWVRRQCRKTCNSCSTGGSCDFGHPCPIGSTCSYVRNGTPGAKVCISGTFDTTQRPGRCPLPTESANNVASGISCNYNAQCSSNQKCCQLASGTYCVIPIAIPSSPTVIVLLDGVIGGVTNTLTTFIGSVGLAQSNGYNVLFDTGGIPNAVDVLNALRDKAGLYPEDIDQVVLSHGHSDHSSSAYLFKDTVQIFDTFLINGNNVGQGPFANGQTEYLLNNDPNLVLLQTPGHTTEDTSLLVKNVPSIGTYALTGDLFMFSNDSSIISSQTQIGNRKIVLCQSQWILPGHGPAFQVTATMRTTFGC